MCTDVDLRVLKEILGPEDIATYETDQAPGWRWVFAPIHEPKDPREGVFHDHDGKRVRAWVDDEADLGPNGDPKTVVGHVCPTCGDRIHMRGRGT